MHNKNILIKVSIIIFVFVILPIIVYFLPFNIVTFPAKVVLSEYLGIFNKINNSFVLITNSKNNSNILDDYLENNYGESVKEVFTIENAIDLSNRNQVYYIKAPFMDKRFEVVIDNLKHKILSDNFYSIIVKDPKFQHLYSEWVKKQVGIDDEGVELELDYGEIDFSNIKTLNETYDELFENCHYTLRSININNKDSKENYKVFNEYRKKYYAKLNKDEKNTFVVRFNEEKYIAIADYIRIGKNDYRLQEIDINQNRSIKILSAYKQLDIVFEEMDDINKLIEEMIPNELTEEKKEIDNLEGKVYAGSILRLDLSNINKYVLDVMYYDIPKEYYNDNKPKLCYPKYIRYAIKSDNSIFKIVNKKEIHQSEYIGNKNEYYGNVIGDREEIYQCERIVDKVTIYAKSDYKTNEIEFYSLKLTGQRDEEKVNEVISKELREITKKYIENNKSRPNMVNSKIHKKYLFNIYLQMEDYIIFESRITDGYLVLDLQEYKFVGNRKVAEDDTYIMLEIESKIFLMYNKANKNRFIDYMIIDQTGDEIKINFYAKKFDDKSKSEIYNWHKYMVNFNNKTMKEMNLEK